MMRVMLRTRATIRITLAIDHENIATQSNSVRKFDLKISCSKFPS